MKRRFVILTVMIIMIVATFGAGCITNGTTDNGNDSEIQEYSYKELYDAGEEKLNGLLDIIENPTEKYTTEKVKVTKKEWIHEYVTIVVHDGEEYEGHGFDLKNKVVVDMGDVIRIGTSGFVISDNSITEDYGIIIHGYGDKGKYRAGYIYYFTPESYEEFKACFIVFH